jgi:hypothetical protein
MKALLKDDKVKVYQDAGLSQPPAFELPAGAELNLEGSAGSAVPVVLSDGRRGFIAKDTLVVAFQRAFLEKNKADLLAAPMKAAPVIRSLEKGAEFDIVATVPGDGQDWVRIRDLNGGEGFLDGKAKVLTVAKLNALIVADLSRRMKPGAIVKGMVRIRKIPEARAQELVDAQDQAMKALAESPEGRKILASKNARLMGIGLLWAIGGIVVTAVSYGAASSSPGGGRYLIAWGAVLFGLYDIARGFFGWLKYKD